METYLDKNGKLLPTFYQDPKWKVMGSILLTIVDCACCMATWGFAIYLVFLKSIFIIAYSLVMPSTCNVDRSKENEKETQPVTDSAATPRISGQRPLSLPSLEHLPPLPSTPDLKARPTASKSEESSKTVTPEKEEYFEDEIVRKMSAAREETSLHTYELKDLEDSL